MADVQVEDPKAKSKVSKALYSTIVAGLGLVCLALSITSLAHPPWAYYSNIKGKVGSEAEKGYFGPWTICKDLLYGRKKCGDGVSRFKPVGAVQLAGIAAAGSVALLAVFSILSILQLAMVLSKDRVLISYSCVVLTKLSLALLSTLLSIIAASLFALQTDDRENDFTVTRGESFYIQIVVIILTFVLFVLALYDVMFSRRLGGDPTSSSRDPTGEHATTFNNPGFKDKKGRGGIAMTDASGKPYIRGGPNGSMQTLSTTLSSNGSTVGSITRSPLRSSLKKPRSNNGIGIQNPGFSGSSPTPSRNGSVKRVRIQSNSTAV